MEDNDPTDHPSEFLASMQEAADILTGQTAPTRLWKPPASVDVRAIRERTGLSQVAFANRFGFSPGAVREWEQGRRTPEAAARVLLLVIARNPEVVEAAIQEAAGENRATAP